MEITSDKTITLKLSEHDSWMLENILMEFHKSRTKDNSDPFDKFARELAEALIIETKKKI